jgi:ATP-dependent Clp protease adaptor protein ClpS
MTELMNLRSSTKPETVLERAQTHIPLYRVLLHNDDANTMDHVVRTLLRVFRFDKSECERIMLEAHRNGRALCTVEPLEQAELHRDQLRSSSLIATIEPA